MFGRRVKGEPMAAEMVQRSDFDGLPSPTLGQSSADEPGLTTVAIPEPSKNGATASPDATPQVANGNDNADGVSQEAANAAQNTPASTEDHTTVAQRHPLTPAGAAAVNPLAREGAHKDTGTVSASPGTVVTTEVDSASLLTHDVEETADEFRVTHSEPTISSRFAQLASALSSIWRRFSTWFNSRVCFMCICFGIVTGAILISVLFAVVRPQLQNKMRQSLILRESESERWAHPNVTAYVYLYFFSFGTDITRMVADEKGPYVYWLKLNKVNVTWNDNSTVSYRDLFYLYFEPSLSVGPEDDTIIHMDVARVSHNRRAYKKRSISELDIFFPIALYERPGFAGFLARLFLSRDDKDIFQRFTVKELVWGYESKVLQEIERYDPLHIFHKSSDTARLPGVFGERNGTLGPLLNVYTGASNFSQLNDIYSMENKRSLGCWATDEANAVRGTDGSMFKPMLSEDSKLTLFDTELYRKFNLEFLEKTSFKDLDTIRFVIPDSAFSNSSSEEAGCDPTCEANKKGNENSGSEAVGNGYCVPTCLPDGVFNLGACDKALQAFISLPHFLGADPFYPRRVEGMMPNESKHRPMFDVDQLTGITVNFHQRYQVNFYVDTPHIKGVYLPFLWSDISIQLTDEYLQEIQKAAKAEKSIVDVAIVIIVLVSVSMIALAIRAVCCAVTYYEEHHRYRPVLLPEPSTCPGCCCCSQN